MGPKCRGHKGTNTMCEHFKEVEAHEVVLSNRLGQIQNLNKISTQGS